MGNPSSLPTAEEIAALTEAFRRNPASSAFIELGERLIELGRPRDAVEVGARGLKANAGSVEGRMMVARAFAALHQWKEAQAELLKVVKADRNHASGFRLLGEVLMRRNDYERAVPVLQHAQNLSPSDPIILNLLRRARSGQPLEAPPPIPTPRMPQSGRAPGGLPSYDDEAPTHVAADVLGRVDVQQREVRRTAPPPPPLERDSAAARGDARGRDAMDFGPVMQYEPPPVENPLAPLDTSRSARPSQAPPQGDQRVRPRVMSAEKPKDAAQASLRQSAAVGEQYLNNLLTGGLLDVPNVRVADDHFDVAPGKRWGRSGLRMFIYLFVVLLAAGAGGGAWYWYAEKQKTEDVARHLATAQGLMDSGDRSDLAKAVGEARSALDRDKRSVYTMAVLAQATGLSHLLYGEYSAEEVERAADAAARDITDPGQEGYRELLIARASATLAMLYELEEAGESRLAEVRASLEDWLQRAPEDGLVRWLVGRCDLALGNRKAAFAALENAHARGQGPVIAAIELGNYYLDAGDFETAMNLYDAALARSQNHPLAFVGRSLARSERRGEPAEAMADINIGLAQVVGQQIEAWKALALATAQLVLEDYGAFQSAIGEAVGVMDPRFLARVGLARISQGEILEAAEARSAIRWFGADPQVGPLVTLLDAELLMVRGLPGEAIKILGEATGVRAGMIRGRALFDLAQYSEALRQFEEALTLAPEDVELKAWTEAARMVAEKGDVRQATDEALDSLGRKAKSKSARFIHGQALLLVGKTDIGKDKLEQSVTDITEEYPNPLAYRSYHALAQLELAAGNVEQAVVLLDKATAQNPGYLPIRDLLGQALVATDAGKALGHLADAVEAGQVSAGGEVAYARALVKTGGSKEQAVEALRRGKDKGAPVEVLQTAITEIDPALFATLEIPPPVAPKK